MGQRTVTKLGRRAKGKREDTPSDAALADVLAFPTPEGLSESYDLLKLIGMVVGQIALLDAATSSGDMKAKVSAARALASLKEDPAAIAERLKAGPFADLTTADLRLVVEQLKDGKNPKQVLERVIRDKQKASA